MICTDCNVEAVWKDLGRDVGQWWYCRSCKKDDSEWSKPAPSFDVSKDTPAWMESGFSLESPPEEAMSGEFPKWFMNGNGD
jgi:hypothetical protein